MANELNIYDTFKKILQHSKIIQGRFFVADGYANDLNADNLSKIFKDTLGGIKDPQKYPLCMMYPPMEIPLGYDKSDWTRFQISMFFLAKPDQREAGMINAYFGNNTSQHTVEQTWKDMASCAKNFRKTFIEITENNFNSFIVDGANRGIRDNIRRYSKVGNDDTAGVGIQFQILLHDDCDNDEYIEDVFDMELTGENLHPTHKF